MTDSFCIHCGVKAKNNTINNDKGDFVTTCPECFIQFRYYVISKPTKTVEEAEESFNKTPLSNSQRYGGTTRGKKRKRKKK